LMIEMLRLSPFRMMPLIPLNTSFPLRLTPIRIK
jgi:hypothetical protein